MSLIIKLKNTNFGATGLPVLERSVYGFPADGLSGLYLMEDGAVDAVYNGTFADSSGLDNHASRRGDWSAPTRKSYGMQTAAGNYGLCIETPIPMGPNVTAIFVGRHTQVTTTGNGYPAVFGPASGILTTQAGNHPDNKDFCINIDLATGSGNDWAAYNGNFGTDPWGALGTRLRPTQTVGKAGTPSVVATTFDNDAGKFLIKTLDANARYEATGLIGERSEWVGNTADKICFGIWRHANQGAISGEIMLAAFYSKALTEAQLDRAMEAARARVAARGVTISAG